MTTPAAAPDTMPASEAFSIWLLDPEAAAAAVVAGAAELLVGSVGRLASVAIVVGLGDIEELGNLVCDDIDVELGVGLDDIRLEVLSVVWLDALDVDEGSTVVLPSLDKMLDRTSLGKAEANTDNASSVPAASAVVAVDIV